MTGCWTSSTTWPTGRRARSWSSRPRGPSCSRSARRGAAASATRRRSTSTRCRRPRARRCSTTSSPDPAQPELKRTIVERSEGNPLYVEEIVRKLIDDGVLRATEASRWEVARPVDDIELPRSIQGLIAARLDGLPDDEKAVLQDAAVVGRVFWLGPVAELTGRPDAEVRDALGRLRVKELVVPARAVRRSPDELEFAFRHVLIRDGAYDSLPKSLRADKHVERRAVGGASGRATAPRRSPS